MQTELKTVHYNPLTGTHEGRIDITRGGIAFRYPCTVKGPVDMPLTEIRRRMSVQALRMSDTPA